MRNSNRQDIRFCHSADGTRIAVASVGRGPVILRAAHWLSHVTHDLESPVWSPWVRALSAESRYVRYDLRGCGLSDRTVERIGFDAWLEDLEAVAETVEAQKFTLLGMSQGGALAIAYALRHPERVERLVLAGAYCQGALVRASSEAEGLEAETLVNFIRIGWGRNNPAFRQVFTNLFLPGGTPEQHQWWSDLERLSASSEMAARTMEEIYRIDVLDMARKIEVPTLVFHARDDARVPFDEGRNLAAAVPGARFVPLDSANHVLLEGEAAWTQFQAELRNFVETGIDGSTKVPATTALLTPAEKAVLALVAEGLGNRAIADRLGKREKTVRNQVSSILAKMEVGTRAEAIIAALRAGIGPASRI